MSVINVKQCHPKIIETIERMIIDIKYKMPFYGEFNLMVNFKDASESLPTCGVNVSRQGMNFYYNTDFLNSLGTIDGEIIGKTKKEKELNEWERQKQINFIVLHEDFHLLFNHPKRTVAGKFDPYLSNIAQDMIINAIIWEDISHEFVSIPKYPDTEENRKKKIAGRNMALFLPKEYIKDGGEPIFEELYTWLKEKKEEYEDRKAKQGMDNQCQTCNGSGKDPNQSGGGGQSEEDDENSQGQGQGQNKNDNQDGQGQGQGDGNNQDGQGGDQDQDAQGDQNGDGQGGDQDQDQDGQGGDQDQDQNGQGGGDGEPCPDCGGSGTDGTDQSGNPEYGPYGQAGNQDIDTYSLDSLFENMDKNQGQYLDVHMEDDIPDELRDSMVRDTLERLKARGFTSNNVEQTLNKLRKKRKDYLREIKRSISNEIMGTKKMRSITRPNRRGIKGIKGNRKVKTMINVVLDTSGSMYGMFEKVLEYVFQNDIEINICQVDTQVHSMETIKSMKELQKIDVKGLGGTVLQPAIDMITDNPDYNKHNTVLLTDGWCDTLDMSKMLGRVLGVTCGDSIPISSKPKKGYREILVEKNS